MKALRTLLIDGAMIALIWLAIEGNKGAGNLLVFVSVMLAVLCVLAASIKEVREAVQKRGRTIPAWISYISDYGKIFVLVWFGWWITAIMFLIATTFGAAAYVEVKPKEDLK